MSKPRLNPHTVINACNTLSESIGSDHVDALLALGLQEKKAAAYIAEAKEMLSKDYLLRKIQVELGEQYLTSQTPHTPQLFPPNQVYPLGVLFHIAAGNMDGLPFYSVIEGLLVGNVNILKLPQQESGLSVMLFQELFRYAPELAEYVYVFDLASSDTHELQRLADLSDGIVVWGGDGAVAAARKMAKPNTKIVEWGHKLSFAYATREGMCDDAALNGLAAHIVQTDQLLCSSCQGIYLDTDSMDTVYEFCERFLPILHERGAQPYTQTQSYAQAQTRPYAQPQAHMQPQPYTQKAQNPGVRDISLEAQLALHLRNAQLESIYDGSRLYKTDSCSIMACQDKTLSLSFMFRNCWAKRLLRAEIVPVLKPYKGYLQTVGLLCAPAEREELADLFYRAGLVRVTSAEKMSATLPAEAHDGEYPLRRYSKVVSYLLYNEG